MDTQEKESHNIHVDNYYEQRIRQKQITIIVVCLGII